MSRIVSDNKYINRRCFELVFDREAGIDIKANTYEYREWLLRINKVKLIRRSEERRYRRKRLTEQLNRNKELNNIDKSDIQTFTVEPVFSFINNPEETIRFFNDLLDFLCNKSNFGKRIYIDISKVKKLSSDALMYLVAVVRMLKKEYRYKYEFIGNLPKHSEAKKIFTESGFLRFVKYQGKEIITPNSNTLRIESGQFSRNDIAKQMTDFVAQKANVDIKYCKFIFVLMTELMSNTFKHAYSSNDVLVPHWYCYAKYEDEKISFTFLDTGDGIPTTVKKKFYEKMDVLNIAGDSKYVVSALNGDFRTSTNEYYRGKGLPKIRDICSKGKISNVHIITNGANVIIGNEVFQTQENPVKMKGTVFCWEVDLKKLKEDVA